MLLPFCTNDACNRILFHIITQKEFGTFGVSDETSDFITSKNVFSWRFANIGGSGLFQSAGGSARFVHTLFA